MELSEETDAVVVVVSEESGAVSYAYKGELVRGVSQETLRAFLTAILVKPMKARTVTQWLRSVIRDEPKAEPAALAKSD